MINHTKRICAAFAMMFVLTFSAAAQSPVIKNLRTVIADAPNGFVSLRGEVTEENKEKKATFYKSTLEAAGGDAFMVKMEQTGKVVYAIRYDIKNMQSAMLPLITKIIEQYIAELNEMVKSGKYTGREYTSDDGMSVTEINDQEGRHILDYSSNADWQNIYVFSTVKS